MKRPFHRCQSADPVSITFWSLEEIKFDLFNPSWIFEVSTEVEGMIISNAMAPTARSSEPMHRNAQLTTHDGLHRAVLPDSAIDQVAEVKDVGLLCHRLPPGLDSWLRLLTDNHTQSSES